MPIFDPTGAKAHQKCLDAVTASLDVGETVVDTAAIMVGLKQGIIALTDHRIFIVHLGTLSLGNTPRMAQVRLENILAVDFIPGGLMDSTKRRLVIESRSGNYVVQFLHRRDAEIGAAWPNKILDQQASVKGEPPVHGSSDDDLAAKLARLSDLHAEGSLSDGEFAAAKRRHLRTLSLVVYLKRPNGTLRRTATRVTLHVALRDERCGDWTPASP